MTQFDNIKSKNIDEFAEWLDEKCLSDSAPWYEWFDENYCKKCETICQQTYFHGVSEYAWCELNNDRCRFFQDMNEIPYGKDLVKMWLETEV